MQMLSREIVKNSELLSFIQRHMDGAAAMLKCWLVSNI